MAFAEFVGSFAELEAWPELGALAELAVLTEIETQAELGAVVGLEVLADLAIVEIAAVYLTAAFVAQGASSASFAENVVAVVVEMV